MSIFSRKSVEKILEAFGFHSDANDPHYRIDSGETALFVQQLRFVETELYKVEYPANRARDFIPVDTSVPPWAETYGWRQYDWSGMAKIITRFSDDLPTVDLIGAELFQKVQTLGDAFHFTIQDVRAAAKNNIKLETEKAELAREAMENKIEDLAKFGDTATGLPGFLNNANVPVLSAPGTLHGDWLNPATTPKQILQDMHDIANSIPTITLNTQKPDTMLLPFAHYAKVVSTQLTDFDVRTIAEAFIAQSPYIRNLDQWIPLSHADAALTGPRVVAYRRDPKVVRLVLPSPFNMLPPQPKNLAFSIPCEGRIGGVSWRRPLGAVYADLGP